MKKETIALLIKGISSTVGMKNSDIALNLGEKEYKKLDVDFFRNLKNLEDNIIKPLQDRFNLKIYLSTYQSNDLHKIEKVLNPEKTVINDKKNHPIDTFINGLEVINKDDDYVLTYRFDGYLKDKIVNFNLDFDKNCINFPWRESGHWQSFKGVGDLIFLYPLKLNECFMTALKACKEKKSIHRIYSEYRCIDNESKVNFITNQYCNMLSNPLGGMDREKIM
jgi:hypothetical protein